MRCDLLKLFPGQRKLHYFAICVATVVAVKLVESAFAGAEREPFAVFSIENPGLSAEAPTACNVASSETERFFYGFCAAAVAETNRGQSMPSLGVAGDHESSVSTSNRVFGLNVPPMPVQNSVLNCHTFNYDTAK